MRNSGPFAAVALPLRYRCITIIIAILQFYTRLYTLNLIFYLLYLYLYKLIKIELSDNIFISSLINFIIFGYKFFYFIIIIYKLYNTIILKKLIFLI